LNSVCELQKLRGRVKTRNQEQKGEVFEEMEIGKEKLTIEV